MTREKPKKPKKHLKVHCFVCGSSKVIGNRELRTAHKSIASDNIGIVYYCETHKNS